MSTPIVQFGKSLTADFQERTYTFEMEGYFEVKAGDYAILDKADYAKQQHNLVILAEKLKSAESALKDIKRFDDQLEQVWGDPGERASHCLEMLSKVTLL